MKTDVRKNTYYLELQAVWPAALKVQLRESNSVSIISCAEQTFVGDDRENGTFFVYILSSCTTSSSSFSFPQCLSQIQLLFPTRAPSLSCPKVKKQSTFILQHLLQHTHIQNKKCTAPGVRFTDAPSNPSHSLKVQHFLTLSAILDPPWIF